VALVHFPGRLVDDWQSFHQISKEVFGFPDFYGMNMDAWIDCLRYVDDGMSRFDIAGSDRLEIVVDDSEQFRAHASEIFEAFVEAVAFINDDYLKSGDKAKISLVMN
jgi:RNAse (barnase) inhibitor barstar